MSFTNETWEWVKTAPLPVVLSICLTSFTLVGSYAYSIDKAQQRHAVEEKAAVAVAAEQAKTAAEIAKGMDGKIDKLLQIVIRMEADKAAEDKAAKKEKK